MKTFMANPATIDRKWYVVDAEGQTLGRLASEVAKVLRSQLDKIDPPKRESVMEKLAQAAEKTAPASPSPKRKEPER